MSSPGFLARCYTVISGDCNQDIFETDGLIEMREEGIQQGIRLNDESLLRGIVRGKGVAINVGRRDGDCDHVGNAGRVFAEFFRVDEGLRKVKLILDAGSGPAHDFVETSLWRMTFCASVRGVISGVEIFRPLGKL